MANKQTVLDLIDHWTKGAEQCRIHAQLNDDSNLLEAAKVLEECAVELENALRPTNGWDLRRKRYGPTGTSYNWRER